MKKLTAILILFTSITLAQEIAIQEIELVDNSITYGIKDFIESTKSSNTNFREKGYVELRLLYYDKTLNNSNVKVRYRIKDQYTGLKKSDNYPIFYTYVSEKLVLLYFEDYFLIHNNKIKNSSKKKLSKKIETYLSRVEHIVAKDANGYVIIDDNKFRDETYNLHGGMVLIIYDNINYELIKAKN